MDHLCNVINAISVIIGIYEYNRKGKNMDFNNNVPNQNGNPYTNNNIPSQNRNPYGSAPSYPPIQKSPADGLITAAMVLGIAAIISAVLMTVYFPFILGGIAIILAILSKGYGNKMHSKAKTGIICAIIGITFNLFIVIGSLYTVFSNPTVFREFDAIYEQFYGESFTDMYKELTGEDFPF